MVIDKQLVVVVDRVPEKISVVDCVADVLQSCKFRFHKNGVIAIVLMTHQTESKFDVRKIAIDTFPSPNCEAGIRADDFGDVFAVECHTTVDGLSDYQNIVGEFS